MLAQPHLQAHLYPGLAAVALVFAMVELYDLGRTNAQVIRTNVRKTCKPGSALLRVGRMDRQRG